METKVQMTIKGKKMHGKNVDSTRMKKQHCRYKYLRTMFSVVFVKTIAAVYKDNIDWNQACVRVVRNYLFIWLF